MKAKIDPTVLSHRVGTCPACRGYLWAEVTIEVSVSAPTLSVDGRAAADVHAEPVAMSLAHECDKREWSAS